MKRFVIATASALFLLAGTAAASVPVGPGTRSPHSTPISNAANGGPASETDALGLAPLAPWVDAAADAPGDAPTEAAAEVAGSGGATGSGGGAAATGGASGSGGTKTSSDGCSCHLGAATESAGTTATPGLSSLVLLAGLGLVARRRCRRR